MWINHYFTFPSPATLEPSANEPCKIDKIMLVYYCSFVLTDIYFRIAKNTEKNCDWKPQRTSNACSGRKAVPT